MMYRCLKNCSLGGVKYDAGSFAEFATPPHPAFWSQAEMDIDKPMTLREYGRQSNAAMDFNEAMAMLAASGTKPVEVL